MKVLIVAPAWVGDMVMAHGLVQLLARRGEVEIHALAPPATAPLTRRMAGITTTHVLEIGHGELALARRWAVARSLAAEGYGQAILLPNTFKSALVPLWAGIPRRTGWHGESRFWVLNDRRQLDAARYPRMIERFLALGLAPGERLPEPIPAPVLEVDTDNRTALAARLGLELSGGVVALCPGAEYGPAKRWPAAHYAAVARAAMERGRPVWLLGSPAERACCEQITRLAPGAVNLAGSTGLLDAVDLLSAADMVVCNDSGLMHVAAAVGCRVVAIFGSTSADFTPPLAADARVLRLELPCSPCFRRTCPLGHLRCLRELRPERVIAYL